MFRVKINGVEKALESLTGSELDHFTKEAQNAIRGYKCAEHGKTPSVAVTVNPGGGRTLTFTGCCQSAENGALNMAREKLSPGAKLPPFL